VLILFTATGFSSFCQEPKVAVPDTIQMKTPVKAKKDTIAHSPHKATIYSAVLPGLGQIYNRKYWKVPLVYGGFAAFGYFIKWNNDQYNSYKQAYNDLVDDDPNTTSYMKLHGIAQWDLTNSSVKSQLATRISNGKDAFRRYRDLNIIGTVAFYALNIIDASVDAHFFNFDISDDLSMNWTPGPVYCMDNRTIGIYFKFNF
jgi:hypothetical protein